MGEEIPDSIPSYDNPYGDYMIIRMIVVALGCLLVMTFMALSIPMFVVQTVGPQVQDAVQDEKISRNEQDIARLETAVHAMDGKINTILGGVAGIYGVIGIVGIINAIILSKRGAAGRKT